MHNIRLAEIKDIHYIKEIIDSSISQDYYSEDDLKNYILNPSNLFFLYVDEEDKPLACLLCELGGLKEVCQDGNIPFEEDLFRNFNKDTKVIIYKTAATLKSSRNKGILTEFLKEAGEKTRDIDHDLKMCLCIIGKDNIIPVKHHVENDGFIQIKRYKSPWSHIKSYCSYCDNEYCQCDGMLYIKENK